MTTVSDGFFGDEFKDLSKIHYFTLHVDDCTVPTIMLQTAVPESEIQMIEHGKRIWLDGAFSYVKIVLTISRVRHRHGTVGWKL